MFVNKSKKGYNANISDIENEYITTVDYNKSTKNIVDNSIKSKNFNKSNIAGFTSNTEINKKAVTSNISTKS